MRKKKIVVLHSGGLDSTVCLLTALERGHEVVSLGVNYNQTHQVELAYAAKQCAERKVERRVISVNWEKPSRIIPMGRTIAQIRARPSTAFLPGRNGIFLMLAATEAAGIGANEFWTGTNSEDFSGYPDATAEFIEAFRSMLAVGIPKGPRLVAPLQKKSKPQIARMAKRLGLSKYDTWSCYRPVIGRSGLNPCGKCDACALHEFAWQGIK